MASLTLTTTQKFWNSVDLLSFWSPYPIFPDNSISTDIFSFSCTNFDFLDTKVHSLTSETLGICKKTLWIIKFKHYNLISSHSRPFTSLNNLKFTSLTLTATQKFWNSVDLLSSWSPHPIFPDNSICVNIFSFTCPKSNFLDTKVHFLTSNHFFNINKHL